MNRTQQNRDRSAIVPAQSGASVPCPTIMTEEELIQFLRIPEVSNATNHRHVIENLKRLRNLPRIHLCNKALYPKEAIEQWIQRQTTTGN